MQCLTYRIALATTMGSNCDSHTLAGQLARFHMCTSLAPRPMTVVFDLGMRPHV